MATVKRNSQRELPSREDSISSYHFFQKTNQVPFLICSLPFAKKIFPMGSCKGKDNGKVSLYAGLIN